MRTDATGNGACGASRKLPGSQATAMTVSEVTVIVLPRVQGGNFSGVMLRVSTWSVLTPAAAAGVNTDQVLTLSITPLKFPPWTRGKTITVTSLTVIAGSWEPGSFLLAPQAPLPVASVLMTPVGGVTEPNVCAATITMPPNTPLGTWSFKLQQQGAANFQSLNKNLIGDVLLLVNYDAS